MSVNYDCHLKLYIPLQIVFCQTFHAILRETGGYILMFCICCLGLPCWSIHTLFVDFVLLSLFHYETITKAISSFFMQERIAVEPGKHGDWLGYKDSDCGEVSSIRQPPELQRANSLKVNKHKNYFILVIVWMIGVQSVNIIVWPRPLFEMTQFKMPCGTYDPLWLISRLNTAFETTFH